MLPCSHPQPLDLSTTVPRAKRSRDENNVVVARLEIAELSQIKVG